MYRLWVLSIYLGESLCEVLVVLAEVLAPVDDLLTIEPSCLHKPRAVLLRELAVRHWVSGDALAQRVVEEPSDFLWELLGCFSSARLPCQISGLLVLW